MIIDTYVQRSVKEGTREERGEAGSWVQLEKYDQHMMQGKKWQEFLRQGEHKEQLIELIWKYFEERQVCPSN